jgi:hypothetical protein
LGYTAPDDGCNDPDVREVRQMRTTLIALVLVLAGAAWADDYGWNPNSLDIGGQHVLTFRAGSGKLTSSDRRAMLEFRLIKALTHTEYLKSVNMSYRRVPGGVAVYANGVYYVTVTPDDAKANNSTMPTLAEQWGRSIKRTFEIVGPARQLPHTGAAEPRAPISLD